MAQWEAHRRFADNCASTGTLPRSLRWSPPPPWGFTNPSLNQEWATTITRAQSHLMHVVSKDCLLKIKGLHTQIQLFLQDLAGHTPAIDYQEISQELQATFATAVETRYAEKILARTKVASKRGPSPSKRPKLQKFQQKHKTSGSGRQRGRQPPKPKGPHNRPQAKGQGQALKPFQLLLKALKELQ